MPEARVHHGDPFDRMIIATALLEDVPLIGGDRQIARYKGLQAIWQGYNAVC